MNMSIITALKDLGIPIMPLRPKDKAPIHDDWTKVDDSAFVWSDGCNIGLRAGMPIGKINDRYTFGIDIDKRNLTNADSIQLTRLSRKFFKRQDGTECGRIFEHSGGKNNGKHIFGCSHIPFSFKKHANEIGELSIDMYGLNASYNATNIVITPSFVDTQYTIMDEGNSGHIFKADEELIIRSWKTIKESPISEMVWLSIVRDDFGYSKKKIFTNAFLPLICSDDFNRDFFGRVLSAIAVTYGFNLDTLCDWVLDLLNLLPHPDKVTVDSIMKFIRESSSRKREEWPGFPTLKESIARQIPIQRGYDMTVKENSRLVEVASNFYVDLIAFLFDVQTVKKNTGTPSKPALNLSAEDIRKYSDLMLAQDSKITVPLKGFCFEDFMYPGGVGMMFGGEGTVKTWAGLDMAIAGSLGEEFWGGRYTFREAVPVLYVYADRNMANFRTKYINRYCRKGPVKFFYSQDWPATCRDAGLEPFDFDISDEICQKVLTETVRVHNARIIIIDTLASCLSLEVKNEMVIKKFMREMRSIASATGSFIWLQHHSNKMNAVELRGKMIGRDDYQGSKMFSSLSDFTITVTPSDKALCGHVRIGKHGTISEFEDFDYRIVNTPLTTPLADGTEKIVSLELSEPVGIVFGSKSSTNIDKLSILRKLPSDTGKWILGGNLREALKVGTGGITPYRYKCYIKELRQDKILESDGETRNCKYFLTATGREYLDTYGDSTCLI